MNTGTISRRYATALLKLVDETGGGEKVVSQVKDLLADPDSLSGAELCPELEKFVALLVRNGRIGDVRLVFSSFVRQYNESRNIHVARLVTAVDNPELVSMLTEFVRRKVGGTVEMQSRTDPSIIGGFVLDLDGSRLDASVIGQLEKIRTDLTEKNKRIV